MPGAVTLVLEQLGNIADANWTELDRFRNQYTPALSRDQLIAIVNGLASLKVIDLEGRARCRVDKERLVAHLPPLRAAHAAVQWAVTSGGAGNVQLLVSAPADAKERTPVAFERIFWDLRTTLRSLIADCRHSLVLASPYWDIDVVEDIYPLLERRLDDSVDIRIVSRRPRESSAHFHALRRLCDLIRPGRICEVRLLEEPSSLDPFHSRTFHFKVAVADSERVYLGSANFNTAGLASRWELGVLLAGLEAKRIAELLKAIMESSSAYQLT